MTKLTDEDYIEIRKRVYDAIKLPFITWGASQLIEGDVPALLNEVELLRSYIDELEASVITHCTMDSEPYRIACSSEY